jgi:hypothetical protein
MGWGSRQAKFRLIENAAEVQAARLALRRMVSRISRVSRISKSQRTLPDPYS